MRRVILGMLVLAVVLLVTYWSIWFMDRSLLASETRAAYYEFEQAFPLADAWLGVACVIAFVTLWRRMSSALFWLVAAGASGLYLFGMDFLYDVEHDIYSRGAGGAFEAVIVAATLVFSVTVLHYSWRHRAELLAGRG